MSETFELEIATPERLLVREQVVSAQVPAENGYLGVLPGHAPLFAQLGIGSLSYVSQSQKQTAVLVSQGFIEVRDNHVRVLADNAEMASEINLAAAEQALTEANAKLAHPDPEANPEAALIAWRNAAARVDTAKTSS